MRYWLFGALVGTFATQARSQEDLSSPLSPPVAAEATPAPVPNSMKAESDTILAQLYEAGDRRQTDAAVWGQINPKTPPALLRHALIIAARIGDVAQLTLAKESLGHSDPEVRRMALFALGQIGGKESVSLLRKRYPLEKDTSLKGDCLVALANAGADTMLVRAELSHKDEVIRSHAAEALALAWTWNKAQAKPLDQKIADLLLKMIQNDPEEGALHAGYALTRAEGLLKLKVTKALKDAIATTRAGNPTVTPLVIRAYSKSAKRIDTAFLSPFLNDDQLSVALESARAIGNSQGFVARARDIEHILKNSPAPLKVTLLGTLNKSSLHEWPKYLVKQLALQSDWVQQEMIKAWARVDAAGFRLSQMDYLKSNDLRTKLVAIQALGLMQEDEDIRRLMRLVFDDNSKVVGAALQALNSIPTKKLPVGFGKRILGVNHQNDVAVVYYLCDLAKTHQLKELVEHLARQWEKFSGPDLVEARLSIAQAMVALKVGAEHEGWAKAKKDPVLVVRKAGWDQKEYPKDGLEVQQSASYAKVAKSQGQLFEVVTNKGRLTLQLSPSAPYTSYRFAQLSEAGFYDKISFHRVVPNFVVQGGDPRGDGFGGPGYMIREELSPTPHTPGSVAMATAGKDSGGSQFFINLSYNVHLNHHYSVFAHIKEGMDVVRKLEQGDVILRIKRL